MADPTNPLGELTKMFEQFKLPGVDMSTLVEGRRKDVEALVAAQDANGDGLLCSKQFVTNQGRDKQWIGLEDGDISDYIVTAVTDNKAMGRGS